MNNVKIISSGNRLATGLFGEKYGGVIGDNLHIFALNSPPNQVRHVAINGEGVLIHNDPVLQDAMMQSCSAHDDKFLLLVERISTHDLYLVTLSENGDILHDINLGVTSDEAHYPHVFVLDDVVTLFWLNEGEVSTIHISEVQDGQIKPVAKMPLENMSFNGHVFSVDNDIVINRLVGAELIPQLIRIHDKKITHKATPIEIDTSAYIHVMRLKNRNLALWQNRGGDTIFGQWLDTSLTGDSKPTVLATTQGTITAFQPYPTSHDSLLIHIVENQPTGEKVQVSQTSRGGRYQEALNLVHKFVVTDGEKSTESQTIKLEGSPYFCGGWIKDCFYLVHGEQAPTLTMVELD